ncbi:T9SS type A sorting domain-containing protein [Flavobacterium sp.]|jgi:hypothetical protein|uniref:T9SS type A sorting domain-containing protein n=1 Tax=Flavobacterium sp. TaxID=239 RepID=UPI0037BF2802
MKKIYSLLLIALTSLSIAQNLVVNPTFSNVLTGWSSTGGGTGTNPLYVLPSHVTNEGQDDSFSVKYIATFTTGLDQKFSVVPGATVNVSFWYKAARTDGGATGNTARIWSLFTDPTSATPTTPINPTGTTSSSDDPLRNNNSYLAQASSWTQVTISSTVPVGATVFQLQLRAYNGATVSFDNISFSSPGASVLGAESFSQIDGMKMYPNPAKNNLFIETALNSDINVAIIDVLGKEVINSKVSNNAVNISGLTPGMYIVKITEEGKTSTKKLIIE